jgi:hypothetical protein
MSLEEVTNVGANAANLPASVQRVRGKSDLDRALLVNIYFDIYQLFLPTPSGHDYISHARHWNMQHTRPRRSVDIPNRMPAYSSSSGGQIAGTWRAADWVTRQYVLSVIIKYTSSTLSLSLPPFCCQLSRARMLPIWLPLETSLRTTTASPPQAMPL